jgi:hypothetical protein
MRFSVHTGAASKKAGPVGRDERDDDHGGRAHRGKTVRVSSRSTMSAIPDERAVHPGVNDRVHNFRMLLSV